MEDNFTELIKSKINKLGSVISQGTEMGKVYAPLKLKISEVEGVDHFNAMLDKYSQLKSYEKGLTIFGLDHIAAQVTEVLQLMEQEIINFQIQ